MTNTFYQKLAAIKSEMPKVQLSLFLGKLKANIGARPLVLYGAGHSGAAFLEFCRENELAVAAFCDRSVAGTVNGIPVVDTDRLFREFGGAFVVVCSLSLAYRDNIVGTLLALGFPQGQIAALPDEFEPYATAKDFGRHSDGYAWAYGFFSDELSKALVIDRTRMYLTGRPLAPNTKSDCYYEEGFITLGEREVFVDGGAYTGDTAEDFLRRNDGAGRVYSFEPDPANYARAALNLAGYANVTLTQKGLWSRETVLVFTPNPDSWGSSFVYELFLDKISVPVTALDLFFADKPELPTFIKMDIEGAEKEALAGCAGIIKKAKPKLAICAYHKMEDVYELPQTILSIRDDYKICLRQHTYGCYDTILYAV
jgi:FkbM family methyltransferase